MSTLTNQQIDATYQGLIKTTDNAAINATPKALEDGVGNALPIEVGTDRINFTDTVDFSGATVTGLAAGGLVAGTGTDAMKSADFLTTNPAVASGLNTIAIGDGASSINSNALAIGSSASTQGPNGIAIGNNASASFTAGAAMAVGPYSDATSNETTAIGFQAQATAANATVIGSNSTANAEGATAIGQGITASIANTASVKALEVKTNSTPTAGGIIMADAGGTDRRINIDASGALQVDSTPVGGGGGSAGLVAGTGTNSMRSADSLTATPAVASNTGTIALGDNSDATGLQSISIGNNSNATGLFATAVGPLATATALGATAFGNQAKADTSNSTAIGPEAGYISGVNTNGIGIGYRAGSNGGTGSVSIGNLASATATDAVALGNGVTGAIAETVSIKELECQTVGGGVIMYSPNGTGYKLTVSDAGAPVFTAI